MSYMQTRRKTRLSNVQGMESQGLVTSESEDDHRYQTSMESECSEMYESDDTRLGDSKLDNDKIGQEYHSDSCPELQQSNSEPVTEDEDERDMTATPGTVIHVPLVPPPPMHDYVLDGSSSPNGHGDGSGTFAPKQTRSTSLLVVNDADLNPHPATNFQPMCDNVPSDVNYMIAPSTASRGE